MILGKKNTGRAAVNLIWRNQGARRYFFLSCLTACATAVFTLMELISIAVVASAMANIVSSNSAETSDLVVYFASLGIWVAPIIAAIYFLNFVSHTGLFFSVQRLGAAITVAIFDQRSRTADVLTDQANNGVLINDIGLELNRLTQQVLSPLAVCFSKLLIVTSLIGYSIVISPSLTLLVAATLVSGYIVIIMITRLRTQDLSAKVARLLQDRMRLLSNYVAGYKFFWTSKNFDAPSQQLNKISYQYADVQANVAVIGILPKASIEMLMVCLLSFFVFSMHATQTDELPITILDAAQLGAITLKLVPSLSALFAGFINIRANMSAWDALSRNGSEEIFSAKPALSSGQRSHPFSPFEIKMPVGFSEEKLIFLEPTSVLFEGSSGSGKTTFFDGLVGLRKFSGQMGAISSGSLLDPSEIAYVPQDSFVFEGSIAENLFWPQGAELSEPFQKVWETCGLSKITDGNYDPNFGVLPGRLSGGQKQRLAIARALVEDKRLLILDESFAGIDLESAEQIFNSIKVNYDMVIFFASHDDQLKKMADLKVEVSRL